MTAVPTRLDHHTTDDLYRLPADDRARYEVLNGSLHVTPPAAYPHNRRAQRLGAALAAVAPVGLEVLNTGAQAVRMVTRSLPRHCRVRQPATMGPTSRLTQ